MEPLSRGCKHLCSKHVAEAFFDTPIKEVQQKGKMRHTGQATIYFIHTVVGHIVSQRREKGVALMKEWIGHSCMWLRRTALLHQVQ